MMRNILSKLGAIHEKEKVKKTLERDEKLRDSMRAY